MYVCMYVYTHHTCIEFILVRRGRQRFMHDTRHIYIYDTRDTYGQWEHPLLEHHRACLNPYPARPNAPLRPASSKTQVATQVPTLYAKR